MPKYFIFSRRKRMCLYNLYSRASQSCLVLNVGVGGAGEKTKRQLTQRFNGARSPVQPLKDLG